MVSESPGRNESEPRGGLEINMIWRPNHWCTGEGSMKRRRLTEKAFHSGGVIRDSTETRTRRLYIKAKAETSWRFWGLYVHVCKQETLREAYQLAKGKKRTALLRKLKEVFRRHRLQPVRGLIAEIHPIIRGWVNYFAAGNSSRCFPDIRDWIEKKARRHLARACQRKGFGWKRWNRNWLYGTLGLFKEYRVSW
jgi:RNA-directed DNA polymerase